MCFVVRVTLRITKLYGLGGRLGITQPNPPSRLLPHASSWHVPPVTLLPHQMDEAGAKPMKNKQEQKNKAQTPRALPPAQTARPYHTVLLSPSPSPPPQLGLSLIGQSKALRFPCWKMGMEAVRGTCSTALQRQDGPAGLHLSFREFYSMQGREQPAKGLPGRCEALQAAQHGGVGARRLWS